MDSTLFIIGIIGMYVRSAHAQDPLSRSLQDCKSAMVLTLTPFDFFVVTFLLLPYVAGNIISVLVFISPM